MLRCGIPSAHTFLIIILLTLAGCGTDQGSSVAIDRSPAAPIINEFLTQNRSGLLDQDGDNSDWIEIYNPSELPLSLGNWALSDNPEQPLKWGFPDMTLGSNQYLLLYASGKDRKSAEPGLELHTNFKLNQQGEFLGLYNIIQGRFVNPMSFPETYPKQFSDVSYGRYQAAERGSAPAPAYAYLAKPTPGQPNDDTTIWVDQAEAVAFNHRRGFYEAPFKAKLSTLTPEATIRFTTNGSIPTVEHGEIYTAPIPINSTTMLRAMAFKSDFMPSAVDTHTYIFLDDVLTQPNNPPDFPSTWGGIKGSPVAADYEMDPEVVNDPRYRPAIKAALQSIPTISIVSDMRSFHDLYANPRRKGKAWERSASIEFIDPNSSRPDFQVDTGLRIQGGLGRRESIPKHAFRIFFRRQYGATKLQYSPFPKSPVEEFNTLVLRSGVNRSYAGYSKRKDDIRLTTYVRDEWLRASQIAMSGSGSHGAFVHLYLNGLYWGLYNVAERPDASFMSSYFGGRTEEWHSINHADPIDNTSDRFKTLHELAQEGHLDNPAKYEAISRYLDIPHFIDYLILNWYAGNLDWAFNNWYVGLHQSSGPAKYYVWDGERTWYDGAEIFMEQDEYNQQPNLVRPLFEALLENPAFQMALADHLYKHLLDDGALTQENAQRRWQHISGQIEQAIITESARWGDARHAQPLTQDDWYLARDNVLAQMNENDTKLIELAREAGYYPAIDPPSFSLQGDQQGTGLNLVVTTPDDSGSLIFYTTNGGDPRLAGSGVVSPDASKYLNPIKITDRTHIKARRLAGGDWSALFEATFTAADGASSIQQVSESR